MSEPSEKSEPSDRLPPGEQSSASWESALDRSLATEPASERFIEDLAERLAAEHARVMADVTRPAAPIAPYRRWRVPAWAALAAGLLLMIAWGTSRPSSGWAAMIKAIAERDWVEVVTESNTNDRVESWFSRSRRQAAVRTNQHVRLDDHASGKRYVRAAGDGAIERQSLDPKQRSSVESQFVGAIIPGTADQPLDAESLRYNLVSETSRELEDGQIELEVVLQVLNSPKREYRLLFTIDPKTNLPQAGQAVSDAVTRPISFRYPKAGPIAANVSDLASDLASTEFFTLSPSGQSAAQSTSTQLQSAQSAGQSSSVTQLALVEGSHDLAETPIGPETDVAESQPVSLAKPSLRRETAAVEPEPTQSIAEPRPPADPLPEPRSIEQMAARIDELLSKHWAEHDLEPTEPAGDYEFVRRAHLDLTGRIPSVNAVRTYMADESPDRRERLIDDLVERYDHASHLATVWRKFLIPDPEAIAELGGAAAFEDWLTDHFHDNTPYDQLAGELLLAEGRMTDGGAMLFYAASKLQPEVIARHTSRVFLGVRMDCAQCHDDFFDERWSQRDFWSFAAFFAQISQPEAMVARVSPVMRVKDIRRGQVKLPDSEEVISPSFPLEEGRQSDLEAASRRQQLVDWLTDSRNPHFAKATANRAWSVLFGRGLVNPLDDMRPENPADCPQLLEELTTYFLRTDFDLRRLLVTLSHTKAYQLSSVASEDNPERRRRFAQMNVKPFTPEQLYDGIVTATRLSTGGPPNGAMASVEGLAFDTFNRRGDMSRRAFLERFKLTPGEATEYQAGITQALALMNGGLTNAATELSTSGLLKSLRAPFMSDKQRIEVIFLATVSRPPTEEEATAVSSMLSEAQGKEERAEVLGDTLWALLNSAEFTLNH